MNEHEKLEKRVDVLFQHLAANTKKIQQERLKLGTVNSRRLDATMRAAKELMIVSNMINEIWENPELVAKVRN